MPITNTIIYLVGPPGVGKLSVGRILAERLPARLVHNHVWLNPVLGLVEQDGVTPLPAAVWSQVADVRRAIFATAATLTPPQDNLVFTHAAAGASEGDRILSEEILAVAKTRGAQLLVVQLTCAGEVLARRVAAPERRAMLKETDIAGALINAALPPFRPDHSSIVSIDNTDLSAVATAQKIMSALGPKTVSDPE